ncbi:MAG: DNA repair protein RadA [Lachnospiraceae bacterium]|nr:DNA repair protein RadA [Lachnospiraceae bacterium]
MKQDKKTIFFCKECGYESPKWSGFCPICKAPNSFVEAPAAPAGRKGGLSASVSYADRAVPVRLEDITSEQAERYHTGSGELDRVLGGGLLPGSLVLTGGDPGIGKSTLLLQVCRNLAHAGQKVLYVSGEESLKQLKLRADRLGRFDGDIRFLCETDIDRILTLMQEEKPQIVVIDSIQTMYTPQAASAPGSVTQVRECTNLILNTAKSLNTSVFIVGHVTKDGVVAGPKILEHMVDTVLYFEGDRHASYRILRGVKNRFGASGEIAVFEMRSEGLKEIPNPSAYMLSGRPENTSGSVISCVTEGTRPLLLEVQALIARSNYGQGRRTATGADYNRVALLLAVLEKRLNVSLSDCDAFVNITGGLKVNDPALDLAMVLALYSSFRNMTVPADLMVFGEVGLAGEVRSVSLAKERVQEAARLGFTTCVLPKSSLGADLNARGMKLVGVANIEEALTVLRKMP